MRSPLTKAVLPLLLLTACEPADTETGAAAPAAETAATDEAAVRVAIEERLDAYEQAALAGDVAGMKAMWTEDARVMEPGVRMSGEEEISGYYDEFFGGGGTVGAVDIRTYDVFAHGDVAYSIGDYDETVTLPDGETFEIHNNYFARWERAADGSWRVDRLVAGPAEEPGGMEAPGQ